MKMRLRKTILALLLTFAVGATRAERPISTPQRFMDVGYKLRAAGHGMDAVAFFADAALRVEKTLGPHGDFAFILTELGNTLRMEGQNGAAEETIRQALDIFSKEMPPGDINTIRCLNDVGLIYAETDRLQEAADTFGKVVAALGNPSERELVRVKAFAQANRGGVYLEQGRLDAAHDDLLAALALSRRAKAMGADVFETQKDILLNLAYASLEQNHLEEAAQAVSEARRVVEAGGANLDWELNDVLYREAQIDLQRGDWASAASALERRREILHRLGVNGWRLAESLRLLSEVFLKAGKVDEARETSEKAVRALEADFGFEESSPGTKIGYGKAPSARSIYETRLAVLVAAASNEKPDSDSQLNYEMQAFEAAQNAHESSAAKAINQLGARLAAGSDDLARALRRRQDLVEELRERQVEATKVVAQTSRDSVARGKAHVTRRSDIKKGMAPTASSISGVATSPVEQKIEETQSAMEALDARLGKEFPKFSSYTHPAPIPIPYVAKLLKQGEALLTTLVTDRGAYIWLITPEITGFGIDSDSNTMDLTRRVAALRRSINASPEGLRRLLSKPFALDEAKFLYDHLLGQFGEALRNVDHLIVVADGPLLSLPFAALVEETPPSIGAFDDYRRVAWLARSYGINIVPSVSAFSILRQPAPKMSGSEPLLGIGDPSPPSNTDPTNALAAYLAQLPPLPESKIELESIARSLGAPEGSILVGPKATRAALEQRDLEKYRVLVFATHGLTPGEAPGLTEPALVLSSEGDDPGLLKASDIATLRLKADLTVLSACDTAAGDGAPGGEGLSGLARAFLYAGTRSLLVSHWPIESDTAASLTTATIDAYAKHPERGRDGALRSAMLSLIDDPRHPEHAHPVYWAPFALVGLPDAVLTDGRQREPRP
jgi:CHAT domain-containing protein